MVEQTSRVRDFCLIVAEVGSGTQDFWVEAFG
jgi:hypothetical protein